WAAAATGRLPTAARPATPPTAVLRKSRRLPPSGATADACGVAWCPQLWPQQLVNRHRGSMNGFLGRLLVGTDPSGSGPGTQGATSHLNAGSMRTSTRYGPPLANARSSAG